MYDSNKYALTFSPCVLSTIVINEPYDFLQNQSMFLIALQGVNHTGAQSFSIV